MDVDKIGAVARAQYGLVSRADLRGLGVTDAQRQTLLARRILDVAGTRAYRVVGAPRTERQAVLEACLDVDGWASHRTAARLHGLSDFSLNRPIEVTVRKSRRSTASALPATTVHCTRWLPPEDVLFVDAIPTVSLARTLLDLAGLVPALDPRRLENAVDEAVRTAKATDGWLWWLLERTRRRGRTGVTVFEAILVRRSGGAVTESWLERETLRILREAGLPIPICQARVSARGAFVARVDFMYPELRVVIEVSGYQFHRSREQTTADAKRRRALTLAGYQVHEFTYDEIVQRPDLLLGLVRELHGLPHVA